MQEEGRDPGEVLISSCARVDAKPVDRDKQMKYDIAKNGEGPLTKTVKQPDPNPLPSSVLDSQQASLAHEKKRKIGDLDLDQAAAASKTKSKRSKGKEKETTGETLDEEDEETIEARLTADDMPTVNERLKNIEEHFALRYGKCVLAIPTI